MTEKILIKDLQKLEPGSELVQLFELEYAKDQFLYVHPGVDDDLTNLQMRDFTNNSTIRTYIPLPIKAEGFEQKQDGSQPRPTLTIANATTALSGGIGTTEYDSLVGLRVIRRLTLKKFLYGESGDASPPIEYVRQVWYVDRIKSRNKVSLVVELASPFDLTGIQLPARFVVANRCPFMFQGASDHLPEHKKAQSGCNWNVDGAYIPNHTSGSTSYNVRANVDDEYVIPASTVSGLSVDATPSNITINGYHRTQVSTTRFNANGTTSSVTKDLYWQATKTTSSPGTISVSNSNFKPVRLYTAYSHGTEYFTYSDDRYNDYVTFTDNVSTSETHNKSLLWKARKPSKSVKPDFGNTWDRGDTCSKDLTGCKMRFGFNPINSASATTTGKAKPNTDAEIPFGGFPAAKAFS